MEATRCAARGFRSLQTTKRAIFRIPNGSRRLTVRNVRRRENPARKVEEDLLERLTRVRGSSWCIIAKGIDSRIGREHLGRLTGTTRPGYFGIQSMDGKKVGVFYYRDKETMQMAKEEMRSKLEGSNLNEDGDNHILLEGSLRSKEPHLDQILKEVKEVIKPLSEARPKEINEILRKALEVAATKDEASSQYPFTLGCLDAFRKFISNEGFTDVVSKELKKACQERNVSKARQFYLHLLRHRIPPSERQVTLLLKTCVDTEHYHEAIEVYRDLVKAKLEQPRQDISSRYTADSKPLSMLSFVHLSKCMVVCSNVDKSIAGDAMELIWDFKAAWAYSTMDSLVNDQKIKSKLTEALTAIITLSGQQGLTSLGLELYQNFFVLRRKGILHFRQDFGVCEALINTCLPVKDNVQNLQEIAKILKDQHGTIKTCKVTNPREKIEHLAEVNHGLCLILRLAADPKWSLKDMFQDIYHFLLKNEVNIDQGTFEHIIHYFSRYRTTHHRVFQLVDEILTKGLFLTPGLFLSLARAARFARSPLLSLRILQVYNSYYSRPTLTPNSTPNKSEEKSEKINFARPNLSEKVMRDTYLELVEAVMPHLAVGPLAFSVPSHPTAKDISRLECIFGLEIKKSEDSSEAKTLEMDETSFKASFGTQPREIIISDPRTQRAPKDVLVAYYEKIGEALDVLEKINAGNYNVTPRLFIDWSARTPYDIQGILDELKISNSREDKRRENVRRVWAHLLESKSPSIQGCRRHLSSILRLKDFRSVIEEYEKVPESLSPDSDLLLQRILLHASAHAGKWDVFEGVVARLEALRANYVTKMPIDFLECLAGTNYEYTKSSFDKAFKTQRVPAFHKVTYESSEVDLRWAPSVSSIVALDWYFENVLTPSLIAWKATSSISPGQVQIFPYWLPQAMLVRNYLKVIDAPIEDLDSRGGRISLNKDPETLFQWVSEGPWRESTGEFLAEVSQTHDPKFQYVLADWYEALFLEVMEYDPARCSGMESFRQFPKSRYVDPNLGSAKKREKFQNTTGPAKKINKLQDTADSSCWRKQ
ncbi:hypothetical protein AAMO2058_001563200 [Amorphochlora amoebiformis]